MERVSGTHHKPYIAVQSGDEKDATNKRNWANSIALIYGNS